MKKLLISLLFLASNLFAIGPTNQIAPATSAVMVNSNGVVVSPTNLSGATIGGSATDDLLSLQKSRLFQPVIVQGVQPPPGQAATVATLTGSGVIQKIYIVTGDSGDISWNGHLQIFTDGEAIPDVDADLGTLFLTGVGAFTNQQTYATRHMKGVMSGGAANATSARLDVTMFYEVPFTNGCVIKIYEPAGGTSIGTATGLFSEIAYRTNGVMHPNLRLKSVCLPMSNSITLQTNQVQSFFTMTNMSGWMVYQGINAVSPTGGTWLERQWFYGVDGESIATNGYGVVTTAYATSGGEDLFDAGWYFGGGVARISGDPNVALTQDAGPNRTVAASYDFMSSSGGIYFTNSIVAGSSLKPATISDVVSIGYTYLFYDDISVPYPPAPVAGLAGHCNSNSITLTYTNPISQGSQPITGFYGTYTNATNSGIVGHFYVGAGTNTVAITNITGSNYWLNLVASNSIGVSGLTTWISFTNWVNTNPTNIPASLEWALNNNNNDSSGNGFTGTDQNGTKTFVTGEDGIANHAANFAGGPWMYSTTGFTNYPLSMSVWIKTTSTAGGCIGGQFNHTTTWNADYLYLETTGNVQCSTGNGGFFSQTSSSVVNDGAWHFVVGVWASASSRTIYVDGINQGTDTSDTATATGVNTVVIGANYNVSAGGAITATLDDFRITPKALSAGEVLDLFNLGAQ